MIRHSLGGHSWEMQNFIDPRLLGRLRVGPLASHLDGYLERIEQVGFLPSSVPMQMYAIARFSNWLHSRQIKPFSNRSSSSAKYCSRHHCAFALAGDLKPHERRLQKAVRPCSLRRLASLAVPRSSALSSPALLGSSISTRAGQRRSCAHKLSTAQDARADPRKGTG